MNGYPICSRLVQYNDKNSLVATVEITSIAQPEVFMEIDPVATGKYLKAARLKLNLNQREVSEKLGFKKMQYISNWERGLCVPPMNKLNLIAEVLDLDREEFLHVLMKKTILLVRTIKTGRSSQSVTKALLKTA